MSGDPIMSCKEIAQSVVGGGVGITVVGVTEDGKTKARIVPQHEQTAPVRPQSGAVAAPAPVQQHG